MGLSSMSPAVQREGGKKQVNNWRKGTALWTIKNVTYLSVVFSWDLPEAIAFAESSKKRVVIGGPAAKLAGVQTEDIPYPALPFHNPLACYTTRGCPNKCGFCAVHVIEGDLVELDTWEPRPIVCDNNILASSRKHFDKAIDRLKTMPYVDFNQGLDAELFSDYHASRMGELKSVKVRFAFDHINDECSVVDAIYRAKSHGLNDIGVYVLIGFRDTPDDAKYRLDKIVSMGILPNPMRYQPLHATTKNSYIGENWDQITLEDMTRYYSRLTWLGHIGFDHYHYGLKDKKQGALV
jgi:hypothetical protein